MKWKLITTLVLSLFLTSIAYARCCPGPCCPYLGSKLNNLYKNGSSLTRMANAAKKDQVKINYEMKKTNAVLVKFTKYQKS